MQFRNILACVLATGVACSPVVAHFAPLRGDLNGDGRFDVLDLQGLASALLNDVERPEADVNGDGQVDILDFQLALAQPEAEPPEMPEMPPAHGRKGIAPPLVRADAQPSSERIFALFPRFAPPRPFPICRRAAEESVTPQTQRYLFKLTPHAPPFAA